MIGNHDQGMLWPSCQRMLNEAVNAQIKYRSIVYYFDGVNVRKIDSVYPAIRPFVSQAKILYTQQTDTINDLWQTVLYDVESSKTEIITEGPADKAAWPRFENGQIKTDNAGSAIYYY